MVSSIGAFLVGLSNLPFFYNLWKTAKNGPKAQSDDPWGFGRSLEWATSCPPPRHNFVALPRIRSDSPAFDLHHPEARTRIRTEIGREEPAGEDRERPTPDSHGRYSV